MKTEGEETRDSGGDGPAPFLQPKIADIAELIANDGAIHSGETRAQKAAADNAKLYTRIEKEMHGNKDAAKAVRRLVKMDQAHRDDFLRTFEGLCDHLRLWPPEDLVDAAQGKGEVILSGGDRGRPQAVIQRAGEDYEPGEDDVEESGTASDVGLDGGGVGDILPEEPAAGEDDDIVETPGDAQAAPASNVTPFRSALDASRAHLGQGTDPEPQAQKKPRGGRGARGGEASVH